MALLMALSSGQEPSAPRYEPCYSTNPEGARCEVRGERRGPTRPRLRFGTLDSLLTVDDYPPSAHRAEAGDRTTKIVLTVGTEGRVTGCRVLRSSGVDSLDGEACRILSRRARFHPALDRAGSPRVSTVKHKVRWKMPPPIRRYTYD